MDKKTQGAWLIHHSKKIQATTSLEFEKVAFAGKAGVLLSAISGSQQAVLPKPVLDALAKANGINTMTELPVLLGELVRQKLVANSGTGSVEVLGLSSATILTHTSTIFDENDPLPEERAVLDVAEKASEQPILEKDTVRYLSDSFGLTAQCAKDTVSVAKQIGLFDSEMGHTKESLLFNGNLFRGDNAAKVHSLLGSLSSVESQKVGDLMTSLSGHGCIPEVSAVKILGDALFQRIHSVGLIDVSGVGNERGTTRFVTRPMAFSKFTNTIADDALDLAKAFVTSLTYGMSVSTSSRGRITMIEALMNKLIAGRSVGPVAAIGQDYQVLELKGVVKTSRVGQSESYSMRLLKPEVGRLALSVIKEGQASDQALLQIPSATLTRYTDPETNRTVTRKNLTENTKTAVNDMLRALRTGDLR